MQYFVKVVLSAILIVIANEVAKRNSWMGAILISLPLSSLLAMSFLYHDTRDPEQVIALSKGILWMLLPSFVFFFAIIFGLKREWPFWMTLLASSGTMATTFFIYSKILLKFGIKI